MATVTTPPNEVRESLEEVTLEPKTDDLLVEMLDAYVGRICRLAIEGAQPSSGARVVATANVDKLMLEAAIRIDYDLGGSASRGLKDMWLPNDFNVLWVPAMNHIEIELR
ncbi:MAG: hypothetical protein Q7T74_05100 [Candidatus Saccharibacteria bacterium]|nr:hypothetical protein [Candidatus Saccharibacteria bacterium]